MNCHAAGTADRLQTPLGGQPALVEGVAGFVQNPHQRPRKIALVVARRDPYIVGDAAAKRMGADIEPAMSEIEADMFHQARPNPPLQLDRKRTSKGLAPAAEPPAGSMTASSKSGRKRASSSNSRSIVATDPPGSYWSSSAS